MIPAPQNIAEPYFVVVFANEDSIRRTVATATAEQKSFLQKMVNLPYIDSIVENAVLLDSFSLKELKSENSLLMHSFYSVSDIGNGPELLKLYVEEMNNPISEQTSRRTYKLLNIEKASVASARVQNSPSSVTNTTNAVNTVSDLFKLVKIKDNEFKPNLVNPVFLNKDGTSKVFYHGTNARWTEHDLSKNVNQMWGEGIYLTPAYNRAKLYGDNVMPF